MNENRQSFENFLREFEPRRPRPLEWRPTSQRAWLRRLAAAAAIPIALGAALWSVRKKNGAQSSTEKAIVLPVAKPAARELLLLPMTEMALNDPERFDDELAKASRKLLPDFRKRESTLKVLAKE